MLVSVVGSMFPPGKTNDVPCYPWDMLFISDLLSWYILGHCGVIFNSVVRWNSAEV